MCYLRYIGHVTVEERFNVLPVIYQSCYCRMEAQCVTCDTSVRLL